MRLKLSTIRIRFGRIRSRFGKCTLVYFSIYLILGNWCPLHEGMAAKAPCRGTKRATKPTPWAKERRAMGDRSTNVFETSKELGRCHDPNHRRCHDPNLNNLNFNLIPNSDSSEGEFIGNTEQKVLNQNQNLKRKLEGNVIGGVGVGFQPIGGVRLVCEKRTCWVNPNGMPVLLEQFSTWPRYRCPPSVANNLN
jgi:hypothetical protein